MKYFSWTIIITGVEHQTHRGVCKQFLQDCWDAQRISESLYSQNINEESCTQKKSIVQPGIVLNINLIF